MEKAILGQGGYYVLIDEFESWESIGNYRIAVVE
jgi:hypothetical protein